MWLRIYEGDLIAQYNLDQIVRITYFNDASLVLKLQNGETFQYDEVYDMYASDTFMVMDVDELAEYPNSPE